MKTIKHKDLEAAIARNPPGYLEEVEYAASYRDEHGQLVLPDAAFERIRSKYRQYREQPYTTPPQKPDGGKLAEWTRAGKRAAHGAKSVAKTSVGIDRLNNEQIEARLNVCRGCSKAVWQKDREDVHTCGPMVESMKREGKGTCGCVLRKKAKDAKEDCPFGYWPK